MSFQSFHFLVFLLGVVVVVHFLGGHQRMRNIFLLLASYYFYANWDWRFCGLLLVVTVSNFVLGRFIHQSKIPAYRRAALYAVLLVNLGVLAVFKYYNFFVDSAAAIVGQVGLDSNLELLNLVLPVGISFYTFQGLSYSIDAYRRKVPECKSFLDFALFVSFFPTLLSGPITRAGHFLPQLQGAALTAASADEGLALICRGFAKKILFADVLAVHFVDPAFSNPTGQSTAFLLLAVYAYSFQIYMDLSGYTDIARGMARLVGFNLPENFAQPYLADSVSNFWQRWHISMSSFFRDYLYFGVGGSVHGIVYVNLLITFVAIGMWHGAGWNFVVYGFLHGLMVGVERYFRTRRKSLGQFPLQETGGWWLLRIFLVFNFVAFSRILFRAENLSEARTFLVAMHENLGVATVVPVWGALLALLLAVTLHYVPPKFSGALLAWAVSGRVWTRSIALAALVLILFAVNNGEAGFVYFRF